METSPTHEKRRKWMAVLARVPAASLERSWKDMAIRPEYHWVRPPETGLVMVRGRAGGTGRPFHLGEVAVTRCTVETKAGRLGTAYVMGRDHRHAELAAVLDALLQDPATAPLVRSRVLEPLRKEQRARRERERRRTEGTRVDFFTMVRGE
jgi:alpha-D-ribose 1-methylphosphonate 5-triphosphate synthase subunit PhnG